ncbi:MAG: hypothetical protein R3Y59_00915 [bacterium]
MSTWSEQLEIVCSKFVEKIANQSGVVALCNGTLDNQIFSRFIMQDSIYLNSFKGSIVFLASRLCAEHKDMMMQFAYGSVEAEQAMQNILNERFDWRSESDKPLPITENYCNFEREKCIQSPVCDGFASLLPCFWLYFEVVKRMKEMSNKSNQFENKYQFWIDSNSDPLFQSDITRFRALCDYYAAQRSENEQQQMTDVFIKSAEMEMQFYSLLDGEG